MFFRVDDFVDDSEIEALLRQIQGFKFFKVIFIQVNAMYWFR